MLVWLLNVVLLEIENMITQVVALFDGKVEAFGMPQFVQSVGAGVRAFGDAVNGSGDSDIRRHPEDFQLFHLGSFDDETGRFTQFDVPKLLSAGLTLKQ